MITLTRTLANEVMFSELYSVVSLEFLKDEISFLQIEQHPPPSPPPPTTTRDWHGGPFPTPWQVTSGTELDDEPTKTATPYENSHRSPPTWLSPGSCANILS